MGNPGMSPSTSLTSSSTSNGGSIASTPSTSPPLPDGTDGFTASNEPYADGPRELIPGVWLGAEDSPYYFDVWGRGSSSVATVNVAQEIENPFDENADMEAITTGWTTHKGKANVQLSNHAADNKGQPNIEYAHLRWSHGESGLSEVPPSATLGNILNPQMSDNERSEKWRFWEAVRWIEIRRRAGIPVIIHCQCGVSRSATLAVAYVMTLAAAGLMPERLGHLRTMQDAYDFVKERSPWIGPNVS
jgi:tyrosine-protein phosphatase